MAAGRDPHGNRHHHSRPRASSDGIQYGGNNGNSNNNNGTNNYYPVSQNDYNPSYPAAADTMAYSTTNPHLQDSDWLIVQRAASDIIALPLLESRHSQLTYRNMQLLDMINTSDTPYHPSRGRTRHRDHQPSSLRRSTSRATRTRASGDTAAGHAHMDPWAPASAASYDSDVFAVGAWIYDTPGAQGMPEEGSGGQEGATR